MNEFRSSLNLRDFRRRATRLTTFGLITAAVWVFVAQAQAPTPPYAEFQYAALTGSGNTITASNVPVVLAGGVTVYENVTLQFNSDANGNLTLASGFPQVVPAPSLITSGFKAGSYMGSAGGGEVATITISGPGVTDGGSTEWSLNTNGGNGGPSLGSWYVGPIASNPLAPRLSKAGITSTAWSYGTGGGGNCPTWCTNTLIGVSQIGNSITIESFTNGGVDSNVPVDQRVYTLNP